MHLCKIFITGLVFCSLGKLFAMEVGREYYSLVITWNPVCEFSASREVSPAITRSSGFDISDNSPLTIQLKYDRSDVGQISCGYSECMQRDFEDQRAKLRKDFILKKIGDAKAREVVLCRKVSPMQSLQSNCKQCYGVKDCSYCLQGRVNDLDDVRVAFEEEK